MKMPLRVVITVDSYKVDLRYFEYFLARELTRRGHSVTILAFGPRISGGSTISDEGFRVVYLPYLFTLTKWFWIPTPRAIRTIMECLREVNPDVIHCMPLYSPLSLASMTFATRAKTVIVGTLFSGDLFLQHGYDKVRFNFIRNIVKNRLAKRVDLFFSLSEYLKRLLIDWFRLPASKIEVVPLGTDPDLFRPDRSLRLKARSTLDLNDRDVVLVYSGKFIPDKGLELLLRAESRISESNPDVKVLLVGKGEISYENSLKDLCRQLGIADKVVFHPFVPREELASLYNAADVAVWPGTHSISMVDAIAVGLPLVLTPKFPAADSLIKDGNGFSFKAGDLDGLVAVLKELVDNEQLRLDMGRRSRDLAERELSWTAIGSKYLDEYEALARVHGPVTRPPQIQSERQTA